MKILILIALFAAASFAQLPVTMSDLAKPDVCGVKGEKPETRLFTGTVVKREFADNAIWLNGVVVADAKDVSSFINIDADRVAELGHTVPDDLSHMLVLNQPVKIWAYECRSVYYAFKVKRVQL